MNGAKWGREEGENTDTRQCSDRKTDKDRAAQEARMHAVTYSTVATGAAILAQYKFTSNLSIMSSLRNNPVAAHLKQASCLKRDQFNFVALVWTRTPRFLFISYISRAFLDEWRSDVLKDAVDSVHLHFISFIFCTLPFSIWLLRR